MHLKRWLKRALMQYIRTSILHFEDEYIYLNICQSFLVRLKTSLIYWKSSCPIGPPNERKPPDPSIIEIPSDLHNTRKTNGAKDSSSAIIVS